MLKLLKSVWIFLIVSSCQSDLPQFKVHRFCQIYIEEEITCLCAQYNLNKPGNTTEWVQKDIKVCHGMMGMPLDSFYGDVEPTIKEIQNYEWDIDY